MNQNDRVLAHIVQQKIGQYIIGKNRFFDYMSTGIKPGFRNISYIRDIPHLQMKDHEWAKEKVDKCFRKNRNQVKQLDGFVTMTKVFAENIKRTYDIDIPYVLFRSYPYWRQTPQQKRPEFVYIGSKPIRIQKHNAWMKSLSTATGLPAKSYYYDLSTTERAKIVGYDYGSEYGILINVYGFNQAHECLNRKLLVYLMSGMKPVIHESFLESIRYVKATGVQPLVYTTPQDLAKKIDKHQFGRIKRKYYSMEQRIGDLKIGLTKLGFPRNPKPTQIKASTVFTYGNKAGKKKALGKQSCNTPYVKKK